MIKDIEKIIIYNKNMKNTGPQTVLSNDVEEDIKSFDYFHEKLRHTYDKIYGINKGGSCFHSQGLQKMTPLY